LRIAGGIIAIIAGLLAVGAAIFTLGIGGLGSALEAEGSDTILYLGYGGIFFSFATVVFASIALGLRDRRWPGFALVACAVLGAVLGGTFVAIFMVLTFIGGLLAVIGTVPPRNQGSERTLPRHEEFGAGDYEGGTEGSGGDEKVCPQCAETVKSAAQICRFCGYSFAGGGSLDGPSQSRMRNALLAGGVAVAALAVGGAVVAASNGFDPAQADENLMVGDPANEAIGSALEVSASELYQAYSENEQAAQMRYGNRPLIVSGRIESIELDAVDEPMVILSAGDTFETVTLHFGSTHSSETAALKKAQLFTARCSSIEEIMGFPQLSGCAPFAAGAKSQGTNDEASLRDTDLVDGGDYIDPSEDDVDGQHFTDKGLELIGEWEAAMQGCDYAAELTPQIEAACDKLPWLTREMEKEGICVVPVPDSDASMIDFCM